MTACTGAAGDCSLRGAVSGAASGDTINFDATAGQIVTLTVSAKGFQFAPNILWVNEDVSDLDFTAQQ